ncbi:hypothetical protein [Streptomyces hydrogenans]|uniref:hypothetical protein n=1 Tax=Streptomyces hydrogenans TaxID=1873719 RepID=UPI003806D6D9
MTEARAHWDGLTIRRPDDVPAATPLVWQTAKLYVHADRLMNATLPANFPHDIERGDADDALAVLALRESMRRDIEAGRAVRIREALELGASWGDVAAALDVDQAAARTLLRDWADGQRALWRHYEQEDVQPFGLDADAHAAVLALCAADQDQAATEEAPAAAPWSVRDETRRYAEALRATPGTASADGHTGWECTAGASLIAEATTPAPAASAPFTPPSTCAPRTGTTPRS